MRVYLPQGSFQTLSPNFLASSLSRRTLGQLELLKWERAWKKGKGKCYSLGLWAHLQPGVLDQPKQLTVLTTIGRPTRVVWTGFLSTSSIYNLFSCQWSFVLFFNIVSESFWKQAEVMVFDTLIYQPGDLTVMGGGGRSSLKSWTSPLLKAEWSWRIILIN